MLPGFMLKDFFSQIKQKISLKYTNFQNIQKVFVIADQIKWIIKHTPCSDKALTWTSIIKLYLEDTCMFGVKKLTSKLLMDQEGNSNNNQKIF